VEESNTSDTGNQRKEKEKKQPAFVGRLLKTDQKREDGPKKRKSLE
jgi:hypothetical protein